MNLAIILIKLYQFWRQMISCSPLVVGVWSNCLFTFEWIRRRIAFIYWYVQFQVPPSKPSTESVSTNIVFFLKLDLDILVIVFVSIWQASECGPNNCLLWPKPTADYFRHCNNFLKTGLESRSTSSCHSVLCLPAIIQNVNLVDIKSFFMELWCV